MLDESQALSSKTLAELSDPDAEELAYFKKIWPDISAERRQQIATRLVELAEDDVQFTFDVIFKNMLEDEDAEVRRQALNGLWENEEPALATTLVRLFEEDEDMQVRAAAAIALGRFAVLAECQKLRPEVAEAVTQTLLIALDNEGMPLEVKRRVLEAASPLSLPQVREAIYAAYYSDVHPLKASAVYSMGKSCDANWLPEIMKELSGGSAELRYEAAVASGELGDKTAVPVLVQLTQDADVEVQLASIQALGHIGGDEAKKCVQLCLESSSEAVRQVAEQAVAEINEMAGLPNLGIG